MRCCSRAPSARASRCRDPDPRHAADADRPGLRGGLPRALQHRRRGPAVPGRAGGRGRGRPARRRRLRPARAHAVRRNDAGRRAGRRAAAADSGAAQDAAGRGRSGDHAAGQLHRAAVRLHDAGRSHEGSHGHGLAAVGGAERRPGAGQADRAHPRPHRPVVGGRPGAGPVAAEPLHGVRLPDARGRRQRARLALPGTACQPRDAGHRHAVGRAGRAGRRHRGGGPHRLRHAGHVAGLWLHGRGGRHAGRPASAGRDPGQRVRGRHAGRRRQHEPRHRRAQLHRRRHRRHLAAGHAGGDAVHRNTACAATGAESWNGWIC